jgi:hypothetical protein
MATSVVIQYIPLLGHAVLTCLPYAQRLSMFPLHLRLQAWPPSSAAAHKVLLDAWGGLLEMCCTPVSE